MKNTFKKLLTTFSILLILVGIYTYFSNTLDIIAVDEPALSSSEGSEATMSGEDKTAQDTAFIYTLTSLNTLKVDTSIFSDVLFRNLRDNSISLGEASSVGRENPFLPINGLPNAPKQAPVMNGGEQIIDKTAVLNGAVESTLGVTNVYFEYGTTEALGKVTPQAKLSLIGSFSSTITGLAPKTTYYYRSVARIDGVLNYGEITSFTTK